jgi:hypothetical protein
MKIEKCEQDNEKIDKNMKRKGKETEKIWNMFQNNR